METTTVPLGGVSKTLPGRYEITLNTADGEPYPVTLALSAVSAYGERQSLSCRIGKRTLQDLISSLTDVYKTLEGDA